MLRRKSRIVVDTNLWISYLLTGNSNLDKLLNSCKVLLLFSNELLSEFLEVAGRPKFRKFFSLEDVEILLSAIEPISELVAVSSEIQVCRDAKYNFFLALAQDGKANYLVTGDADLLVLKKFDKTIIVTIAEIS